MTRVESAFAFFAKPLALRRGDADLLARNLNALSGAEHGAVTDLDDLDAIEAVALIPGQGILSNNLPWFASGTRYDFIRQCFDVALGDPAMKAIVLYFNSPGGDVAGCADLSDHIYESRGTKPLWAILDENAFSAAYWNASAADWITIPRTGGAGSIGVVSCHVDVSKALRNAGIEVTYIQSGARKSDGAPEKPLSDEARKREQASVDQIGELFISTVARNRRGLSRSAVRDMQAGCYLGPQAVAAGLCDEIAAPAAAFQSLLRQLSRRAA